MSRSLPGQESKYPEENSIKQPTQDNNLSQTGGGQRLIDTGERQKERDAGEEQRGPQVRQSGGGVREKKENKPA